MIWDRVRRLDAPTALGRSGLDPLPRHDVDSDYIGSATPHPVLIHIPPLAPTRGSELGRAYRQLTFDPPLNNYIVS